MQDFPDRRGLWAKFSGAELEGEFFGEELGGEFSEEALEAGPPDLDFSSLYGYADPDIFSEGEPLDFRDDIKGETKPYRNQDYLKDPEYVYDSAVLRAEVKVTPLKRYRGGGVDFVESRFVAGKFSCIYSIPVYPPEFLNFARRAYEAILYRADLPVDHPLGYLPVRDVVAESLAQQIWPGFSCDIKQINLKIIDVYTRNFKVYVALFVKGIHAAHLTALPVGPRGIDYNRFTRTIRESGVSISRGQVVAGLSHSSPSAEMISKTYEKLGPIKGISEEELANMFEVSDWRK